MTKIEDIELCVDCQRLVALGKSTPTNGHIPVFYTINPDPERDRYGELSPEKQRRYIIYRFKKALADIKKKYKTRWYSIHYELTKSMNLHTHGILMIPVEYAGYDINLAILSKTFHKYFGRQYGASNIDSKFEWIKDEDAIMRYINKSNVYKSEHHEINQPIQVTEYLESGKEEI